jgi:hypothetical protein
MAFNFSPKVVTDGLIMAFDPANPKCYVSGSTIWRDLTSNLTGSLVNSPAYDSANAGSIVFDSVDDYLTGPVTNNSTVGITISCFFKATTLSGKGIISKNANLISVSTNRIDWWPDVTISNTTITTTLNTGEWYHIAITQTGSICNAYKNGTFIFNSNSTSQFRPVYTQQTILGAYSPPGDGRYFHGNISNVQVYNRPLTAIEVLQNYNALKGRFGLT